MRPQDPPEVRVREHMRRIGESATFRRATQQIKLLECLVEASFEQRDLKEHEIGIAAFGKRQGFDPMHDSIVRTTARDLRKKLAKYYETEGSAEAVQIKFKSSGYGLEFDWAPSMAPVDPRDTILELAKVNDAFSIIALLGTALKATEISDWKAVMEATECFSKSNEEVEKYFAEQEVMLGALRVLRLSALVALKEYDRALSEISSLDFRRAFPGKEPYQVGLGQGAVIFEYHKNSKRSSELRRDLLDLVADPDLEQARKAADTVFSLAKSLELADLSESAGIAMGELADEIRQRNEHPLKVAYVQARYLQIRYLGKSNKHAEGLELYHRLSSEVEEESDEYIFQGLAWSGVEATRSLNAMGLFQEVIQLADQLNKDFDKFPGSKIREAMGFISVERAEACAKTGDPDGAARSCAVFIDKWARTGRDIKLNEPVALAYAHLMGSLCDWKGYATSVSACEEFINTLGQNGDVELQKKVAYTLIENIIALRKSGQLAAATLAAENTIQQFSGTSDDYILAELTYAMHSRGDLYLCEAKALRQNGSLEEAKAKLNDAWAKFDEAARNQPKRGRHLACRSYTEFLLGQTGEAQQTLKSALSLDITGWPDEMCPEVRTCPLPEDAQFGALVLMAKG